MADTADVIVIGAGVQGASLAFHLARAARASSSSSGRRRRGRDRAVQSGLVRMLLRPPRRDAASRGSRLPVVPGLGASASAATAASRRPGSCGSSPRPRWIGCAPTCARTSALGIETPRSSTRPRCGGSRPGLAVEDDEVAAYEPDSGYADPSVHRVAASCGAARDRGARLVQGAEVTAITHGRRPRHRRRGRRKGAFDAPVVVNAAGGWAGRVAALAGLDIPITVWRHDTGLPRRAGRPSRGRSRSSSTSPTRMYFRPEGAELVLVGLEDDSQMGGSPDRETAEARPPTSASAPPSGSSAASRASSTATFRTSHSGQDGLTPDQRADPRPAGRPRRLLPRLRPQRDRVQDGTRRGPRHERADPRRGGDARWTSRRSRSSGSPRAGSSWASTATS